MNIPEPTAAEVQKRLREPFPLADVSFRPTAVKGNRAIALAYLTARAVMDRLDETAGLSNWKTEYVNLVDGNVECRLSVRIAGEWITKADVGNPSEQPDQGDRLKAAYSDSLKRAAVQFGIGRYLYHLKNSWCDYDPAKRAFANTPTLPAWALPTPDPARGRKLQAVAGLIRQLATAHKVTPEAATAKKLADWSIESFDQLPPASLDALLQDLNDGVAKIAAKTAVAVK